MPAFMQSVQFFQQLFFTRFGSGTFTHESALALLRESSLTFNTLLKTLLKTC